MNGPLLVRWPPLHSLLLLAAGAALVATSSLADGMFVWRNEGLDIREPEQKAFILFEEGYEDLVLSVKFEGATEDFAWIVPLPAVPEMFEEDAVLFEHLSKATQRKEYRRSHRGTILHTTLSASAVQVVARETVGIYEATILESQDGSALQDWLQAQGYRLPGSSSRVLDRYVDRGWVFVALRIDPTRSRQGTDAELASGTIQPIRFRFETQEPVFPLEISSLGSGPSTVLIYVLAPEPLVPREPDPELWQVRVLAEPGNHHWTREYEYKSVHPDFLPEHTDRYFVSKFRRKLLRKGMQDVYFKPYEPLVAILNPDEDSRLEAIAHLGLSPRQGASSALLQQLPRTASDRETYGLLWALGENGGPEAEDALIERLADEDPETILESVEALRSLKSRRALPYLVSQLQTQVDRSTPDAHVASAIQRSCYEHIVTSGTKSILPAIEAIARDRDGYATLLSKRADDAPTNPIGAADWTGDPGVQAVVAMAVLGDQTARDTLLEALVLGSETTSPERLARGRGRRGSVNYWPPDFWIGYDVLHSTRGRVSNWYSLRALNNLLRPTPAYRDSLYRQACRDPRLPVAGALLLTANLQSLAEVDLRRLRATWEHAIEEPKFLTVTNRHPPSIPIVRYNHDACVTALVLGRHKEVSELLHLLSNRPHDDDVLWGEIINALAQTKDDRALDPIVQYVRQVWDANARSEAFEPYLDRSTRLRMAPFDLTCRMRAIDSYLFHSVGKVSGRGDVVRSLFEDDDLAPYLRLRCLVAPSYYADGLTATLQAARQIAETLRSTGPKSVRFVAAADECIEYLDVVDDRLRIAREARGVR